MLDDELIASENLAVYSATNLGVTGATTAWTEELAKSGIRVKARRLDVLEDVANIVCFLVSDLAEDFTHQVISVDDRMVE